MYVLANNAADGCCPYVGDHLCLDPAVALSYADYGGLVREFRTLADTAPLSAKIRLIGLADAPEFLQELGFFHCPPYSVHQIPCGLVSHVEIALDLLGRNALPCVTDHECCQNPFLQG